MHIDASSTQHSLIPHPDSLAGPSECHIQSLPQPRQSLNQSLLPQTKRNPKPAIFLGGVDTSRGDHDAMGHADIGYFLLFLFIHLCMGRFHAQLLVFQVWGLLRQEDVAEVDPDEEARVPGRVSVLIKIWQGQDLAGRESTSRSSGCHDHGETRSQCYNFPP